MRRDKDLHFQYICMDIKNLEIDTENIFIQHDIRDTLPIKDNEIEIVLLFGWYHGDLWDIDYQKFLNDINRVTRMNGLLYFDFPTVENKIKFTGGGGGTDEERKNMNYFIKKAGFDIIKKVVLIRNGYGYNTYTCKKIKELK